MASSLCCNPIHVDDEIIDMELEEVWEIHRSRSKSRGAAKRGKPKLKLLGGRGVNGRGLSLTRNGSGEKKKTAQMRSMNHRSMSTGRMMGDDNKTMRGKYANKKYHSDRHRGGRGKDNKKVSISKYVEKIELQQKKPGTPAGRRGAGPPIQRRGRSNSRSRFDIARDARSRSRSLSKNRFSTIHIHGSYDEHSVRSKGSKASRGSKGRIRSLFRRKKQSRNDDDEWSSGSGSFEMEDDETIDTRRGFFSNFR